jgi:signal transduction histidine kinase/ligand-binding sensor domain-containing protein
MKKLISFLFFVLLCTTGIVKAQQLYFNHLSVNNGLSQGVNNCILRDSKGFIWISSFDGLNRFDGANCIIFRSSMNESNGLKGTLFLNILEDKNSNLWIGSNAGLNFYDRRHDRFQNFRIEGRFKEKRFFSPFYIDDKNNIWLQSGTDIIIFKPKDHSFTFFDHFFSQGRLIVKPWPNQLYNSLQKIYAVSNNLPVLWQGDVSDNEIKWNSSQLSIPASRVSVFLPISENSFWIGANNGIYKYQNKKEIYCLNQIADVKLKNVSALHLDQRGKLWVGTLQQGIFTIDTIAGKVNNHYENSAYNSYTISGNEIQYINSDEKGDLWISVWGKGVDYTSMNSFRFNYFLSNEEAVQAGTDNFIRSIIPINNEFWCGTRSGGILILDENKKVKQSFRKGLPLSIEHLCLDKNNQIWASTFEGLFLIDPISKRITKMPLNKQGFGLASNQYTFTSCLNDRMMLASTNAGIFTVEKTKKSYQVRPVKGINNTKDVFLTTYSDQDHHLYISRAFKGFKVYTVSGDSLILNKEFPLEATIKCFSESQDTNLWIGSTIGLIRFNKSKLQLQQIYTTKDGFSNQYIYGIVPDGNYLWMSTNVGINRFNIQDKTVKTFSLGDGLQSNEYNTYSFCKARNQEILFGGVNGMNSFYAADLKNDSYPPQLILTGVQLNDTIIRQVINPSEIKELSVHYNQNTIGFQFSILHYANASANSLSYILEGYDRKWFTVTGKNKLRYSNLPPGHYTLKVRAFSADGIEAENVYSLPINIKPPWWQSLWFELAAILAFLGLMHFISGTYVRIRLEKQRALLEKKQAIQRERNRISRDMHDDLGSGLTMIAILSEVVKKQLTEPEKAKESLEKIAVSSRDLVDNLQDIIWLLNPKNDTIESLSSYIREYGLKYFEPLSVQLEFDYPEHFSGTHLSDEQRRNMFLTVKESFNNIAKHARCSKIILSISETATEISLTITDDGLGFDMNSVRIFANGLKNMKDRIEQVDGTYFITSKPGKGTQTEIKFHV